MTTIYMITNKIDGRKYIGQTKQFKYRKSQHKSGSKLTLIGRAIKYYGWENFEIKALYEVNDKVADFHERLEIKKRKTLYPNGYNLDNGGSKGKMPHIETYKRRMKPVRCIETGEVFESGSEAKRQTGISGIGFVVNSPRTAGGFHWEHFKEKNKPNLKEESR